MTSDKSKFKIAIVGVGGVGGYVGGRLAACFAGSADVEIALAARGENERAIRERGLKLVTTKGEEIVRPKLVSIREIGAPDLILLCTKEYDLEETVSSLKDAVGERTAILPLLNGVDAAPRIARVLPAADVWQGCIYIISRLAAPGVIEETGNICLIYFGGGETVSEKQRFVEDVFRRAGIDAHATNEIEARAWEKFVFISALAAATSFFDTTIRETVDNPQRKDLLDELVAEVKRIAKAKNISVSETAIDEKLDALRRVPPDASSSMRRDFSHGKRAELKSLVGYVIDEAHGLNVPVPVYEKVYAALAEKLNRAAGEEKA